MDPIENFCNPVWVCPDAEGCIFRLTDDDMENPAAALPLLEFLKLGRRHGSDSSGNTVTSLLLIIRPLFGPQNPGDRFQYLNNQLIFNHR